MIIQDLLKDPQSIRKYGRISRLICEDYTKDRFLMN